MEYDEFISDEDRARNAQLGRAWLDSQQRPHDHAQPLLEFSEQLVLEHQRWLAKQALTRASNAGTGD